MTFDPNDFLDTPVDPLPTRYEVIPEGEYQMVLDTDPKMLEIRTVEGISQKTGEPYCFHQLELTCVLIGPAADALKERLGRDKLTARLRINLDIDENGRLSQEPNRNVKLGQLREALGQNRPGWTLRQLSGAGPFLGRVRHVASTRDPEVKFAEVTRVARIS